MPSEGHTIDVAPDAVIEVDPEGKYVIVLPEGTSRELLTQVEDEIAEWWESDNPILIFAGGVQMVRVDRDVEEG